jgi:ComF family protein
MLKSFLSLFLQANCPLCNRATGEIICQYCQRQLQDCKFKNPQQFWAGDLPLFVWGKYEGKLKQTIAALKYEKQQIIADLMGTLLAESWQKSSRLSSVKNLTVIPIPLHPKRLQERGFNQAELIARSFSQLTGYSYQSKGLLRIRDTQAMFNLSPTERLENIRNAFILGKHWQQRHPKSPILLVDDIYTTGATAREAAKILICHNIEVFGIVAMATTK